MRKDDSVLMLHMLEAAKKAVSFAANKTRKGMSEDDMLSFALMKAIEIVGEAASKVTTRTKERFSEIPWKEIIGMRNRLIHAYDAISLDILWMTVTNNLHPFIQVQERNTLSDPCMKPTTEY